MNDRPKDSTRGGRSRLVPGAPVYDAAGDMIGTIDAEALQHDYLTVRQSAVLPHDVYLPLKEIARVEPDGVYLKLSRRALRAKRYATPPQPERQATHSGATQEPPATPETAGPGQTARVSVPLAAEELVARRTPMREGTVRLHKGVETTEQVLAVPVTRDEVIVEHISPDQLDTSAAVGANELLIPIMEEQVVVQKRMVVKEYVRVRKRQVVEQRQVREPVRREVLSVQELPASESAPGVGQPARPLVREMPGPLAEQMPDANANANAAP